MCRPVRVLYWLDVAVFLGFGFFVFSHRQGSVQCLVGAAVAVAGFALWMLARIQLGGSFSVSAEARKLVTTGLYSKFRHPIYLFGGVGFTGLFIAWGRLIPFLVYAGIYSIQILRIRKEQAVLEQAFGEEYRRYKAKTWF